MDGHPDGMRHVAVELERTSCGGLVMRVLPGRAINNRLHLLAHLLHQLPRVHAGSDPSEELTVILHDESVQRSLRTGERAVHRPHAADVTGVVGEVGSVVHEHEVAVAKRIRQASVVAEPGVLTATDDRSVTLPSGAPGEEDEVGDRRQLVLGDAGCCAAHRLGDGTGREHPGPTQQVDLDIVLDLAEPIEHG